MSSTCLTSSRRLTWILVTYGMPALLSCSIFIGTKCVLWYWDQRFRGSRTTTPPRRNACSISHCYSSRLGTIRSTRISLVGPQGYGERRGMMLKSLKHCESYLMQTGYSASTAKGYSRQEKRWEFANGLVTHRDKQSLCIGSLSCCSTPFGSKPRKRPLPAQSISS